METLVPGTKQEWRSYPLTIGLLISAIVGTTWLANQCDSINGKINGSIDNKVTQHDSSARSHQNLQQYIKENSATKLEVQEVRQDVAIIKKDVDFIRTQQAEINNKMDRTYNIIKRRFQ